MYENIWELDGADRLDAIEDLPPFTTDSFHYSSKKNCLRCPIAIRYKGSDGYYHTACTDVISHKKALNLLNTGGRFLKKGEF